MEQTNLANQRKAAMEFVSTRPEVEKITFTQEGSVGGAGYWAANAIVTVDGKDYQAILAVGALGSGEPWDNATPLTFPTAVTLVFSDGTSEVLK